MALEDKESNKNLSLKILVIIHRSAIDEINTANLKIYFLNIFC